MAVPKSVLVVDDASFIRTMIRDILEPEGYVVYEAVNGRDAVEKVKEIAPDLVVMDFVMPEVDGLSALRHMRRADPQLRVVMVSATRDPGVVEEALSEGAMAFVHKPFQPGRIRETVWSCLAAHPGTHVG